ncbi:MAG: aminotransferase class IV family protein [Bacteroides sp.]|nr:aminotransferase class IV family protein [Roseburia sp.]MCM1346542.1 aminotransferase class IV family protein [Bacteroides sp.]MCM1421082.1 aminotransferase class IV family protein [Bacteroides sp.]
MCQFIETIRIEHGQANNLCYHERRLNNTLSHFFGTGSNIQLKDYLLLTPDMHETKCRIIYGEKGISDVSYSRYTPRPVRSLRMVCADNIDYAYKSADRSAINQLFGLRGEQDDILIVRQGLLTDTSIANIALYDGSYWHTPCHPLLKGTRRESLIDRGILKETDITPEMMNMFSRIRLFNAMIDWDAQELPIESVWLPSGQ